MLQARVFSYADAHRHRIGTHYESLPVNAPKCPVHHYHKDGAMRFFDNNTGNPEAYYEPNRLRRPCPRSDRSRAPAAHLRRRRPLQPPRRQRRFRSAPRLVPSVRRRAAQPPLLQHRGSHATRSRFHRRTPANPLPAGRPRLRLRRPRRTGRKETSSRIHSLIRNGRSPSA
jgi:hypothetical protein